MKTHILIFILAFIVGCSHFSKKNKIKVKLVKEDIIRFTDGTEIATNIYDHKLITLMYSLNSEPYYFSIGRECTDCDAPLKLYVKRVQDGGLSENELKNGFDFPGSSYENKKLVGVQKVYYGHCLHENEPVVVWLGYKLEGEDNKIIDIFSYVNIDGDEPELEEDSKDIPDSADIQKRVQTGTCKELIGKKSSVEP